MNALKVVDSCVYLKIKNKLSQIKYQIYCTQTIVQRQLSGCSSVPAVLLYSGLTTT